MEQKSNIRSNALTLAVFLAGLLLGFLIFQDESDYRFKGMHQMPDDKMMHNSHVDMKSMMHDMNSSLKGKTGDDLDKAFLDEMIVHHEGAVEMAQYMLDNSKKAELVNLSTEIIKAQNSEIEMMKKWRSEWFGN